MAEVLFTSTQVARIYPMRDEAKGFKTAVAITAGQAVTLNASGFLIPANANAVNSFLGIATQTVGAGQTCAVLLSGFIAGFVVSAINAMTKIFLSDTDGKIDTVAGTNSIQIGYISSTMAGDKMLYVTPR